MTFVGFVGIDWSGAAGPWQRGLKVAIARPGRAAPVLVPGPGPKSRWSRQEVVGWLSAASRGSRFLIGIDFAFGFPGLSGPAATGGQALWRELDELCRAEPNLYGGPFFRTREHRHGPHIFSRHVKGELFERGRQRATERAAARMRGAHPSSPLLAIGPARSGRPPSPGCERCTLSRRRRPRAP